MSAVVRWIVAVVASVLAFFTVALPWAAASRGESDPWGLIGPVASVVAAGVLAALGWWASRAGAATAGEAERNVQQSARGRGDITQTAGNQSATVPARRRPLRENIRQKARGGGDIDQVGGDRI